MTRKRDHKTGLDNVKYKILKVHEMLIDQVPVTILNILLDCDVNKTPWCDCSGTAAAASAVQTWWVVLNQRSYVYFAIIVCCIV